MITKFFIGYMVGWCACSIYHYVRNKYGGET